MVVKLPKKLHDECECRCHLDAGFKHTPWNKKCCGVGAKAKCEECRSNPIFRMKQNVRIGPCPRCNSDQVFLYSDGSYENIESEKRNQTMSGREW